MSSHREAPEISKDPAADNTDVYAFVSPNDPDRVVLIANYYPLQQPNGGPNFYEFSDDVVYEINISNTNRCIADVRYQFRFNTTIVNPNSFLYATGPINSISDETFNRPQTYSVTRRINGGSQTLLSDAPVPPVNIGPRSTPDYPSLAAEATIDFGNRKFFAGQRSDPFFVDLGSIFDLGALRPLNNAHLISMAPADGVNSVDTYNCHTIAIEVPAAELTRGQRGTTDNPLDRQNVIGVWATARRRAGRAFNSDTGKFVGNGPNVQVSRLGNPLFNEVIVPMAEKDKWNSTQPKDDATYTKYVNKPELQGLLPVLYPGAFPNLAAYDKPRADLNAILMTGIPYNVVPGFFNYTGPVQADMLRLNMAIPPKATADENPLGIVGGDLAGFPNGRRLRDNIVEIELKAIAGATIPLVDPAYTPDGAVDAVSDGTSYTGPPLLDAFPFVGHPGGGYQTRPGSTAVTGPGAGE